MGIEYRVACAPEALPKVTELLQRLGGKPCAQFPDQIEFRFKPSPPEEMPDATVVVESDGMYFVDYGGDREQVALLFRRIVDEALTFSPSESVQIVRL